WLAFTPRYRDLAEFSLAHRAVFDSIVAQVSAIPVGLSLFARPWALSLDHGEPLATSPADGGFMLGVALVALAAAVTLVAIRRPAVGCGAALCLAAILPTQSFIPKLDPLTERPLELALAGLLLAVAPLLARLTRWRLAAAAAAALLVALATATVLRARLYRSD